MPAASRSRDTWPRAWGGLLLELAHQIGEHQDDGDFRFPLLLTHEEMASMTCTTRETVTRTLGQFRKDGWIAIEDSLDHPTSARAIGNFGLGFGLGSFQFCRSRLFCL